MAYAVQTEDIYRDMAEDAATHYDFSEYPLDHPLCSATNRMALGFFKEEKTAWGVKRWVKDAHLHFAHYLDALKNFHTYFCRQNLIKSTLHTVRAVHMCKVGLMT